MIFACELEMLKVSSFVECLVITIYWSRYESLIMIKKYTLTFNFFYPQIVKMEHYLNTFCLLFD